MAVGMITLPKSMQISLSKSKIKQVPSIAAITWQAFKIKQQTKSLWGGSYSAVMDFEMQTPKYNPPPILFTLPVLGKKKKKKGKDLIEGYDVYAKRFGKYFKLNIKPMRKMKALGKGALWADITAGASFQIKPSNKMLLDVRKDSSLWKGLKGQFYKKGKTYIEKTKYRISTPGEKQEITFKGLGTLKQMAGRMKRVGKIKKYRKIKKIGTLKMVRRKLLAF